MPPASRSRLLTFTAVLLAAGLAFLASFDLHRKVESFQSIGITLAPQGTGWLVRSVEASSTGLQAEDRIFEVDDSSPASTRELVTRLRDRDTSLLSVVRGHELIRVSYERPPLEIDVSYLFLAAAGVAYLVIGLFVVTRRPRPPAGLFFLWCAASAAVYLLTFVPTPTPSLLAKISYLVEELARLLLPALTVHLFLHFPVPVASAGKRRGIAPFLYLPSAALGALQLDLVLGGGRLFFSQVRPDTLLTLDRVELIWLGLCSLAALALVARGFLAARHWEARRQMQGITLGLALGYLPFVLLYVAPFALGLELPRWTTVAAVAPLVLVPLAFAWAILRYRLWDLEIAVRHAVSYTATLLLGVLVFSLAHLAIDRGLPDGEAIGRNLLTFLAGLFVAGVLVPTERRVRHRIERWQYRETYESRRTLRRLGRSLLEERRLPRICRRLVDSVKEALQPEVATLLLVEDGELRHAAGPSPGTGSMGVDLLNAGEWKRERVEIPGPALPDLEPGTRSTLFHRGYRYAFPLTLHGEPVAILLLGFRRDGYPLNHEEIDLLRSVLDQTALAIENARLVETLHGQLNEMDRLRSQSERILDSSPVGIAVLDREQRIVMANEAFSRLGDTEPHLVTGLPLSEVLAASPIPRPEEGMVEAAYCDADGRERHYQISTAHFPGIQQGWRVLVAHDVTDKIAMEEALEERERLAALGMLAAGLAHEVNTPITGISSYAQLLLDETPEGDPRRAVLQKMERQTFRASRIVNNLLGFARKRQFEPKPLDLRRVVEEALEASRERLDQAPIDVAWNPPEEPCPVLAGDGELQQVLINLIGNGCDAMLSDGGELRLSIAGDDETFRVVVEDEGSGISSEALEQIFQPFYSTKSGRGGTGLGLAISQQIVARHGGSLGVESEVGVGSRFELELPRYRPGDSRTP